MIKSRCCGGTCCDSGNCCNDEICCGAGENVWGQATPPDGNDFVAISAGGRHSLAIKAYFQSPVAEAGPNQVVYAWIDGIADVVLDGNDSNDPDGDELSYYWSWIVGSDVHHANGVSPAIKLPVGEYVIELIVNDGHCDSESDYVDVNVVGPLETNLRLSPNKVHRSTSRRKYIRAFLKLPQGIQPDDLMDEPLLMCPVDSEICIEAASEKIRKNKKGTFRYRALFDKKPLLEIVTENGWVDLNVAGQLTTGQYFYGTDSIKIIPRK